MMLEAPPRYFPVRAEPLRMQAGLTRFGSDFGNGAADQRFFSNDVTSEQQRSYKAPLLARYPAQNQGVACTAEEARAVGAARAWMLRTLEREGRALDPNLPIDQLGAHVAEDFVVLHCPAGGVDRALWVHVYFPSGWRPEHIVGRSFLEIHARVPAFEQVARAAPSLTEGMATRGPYVRFVWTICADDALDHHPDHGLCVAWSAGVARAWLRVERQITVPLPEAQASLFLIRTYLYGFEELAPHERQTLARALQLMPAEIARYKGLERAVPRALELLSD